MVLPRGDENTAIDRYRTRCVATIIGLKRVAPKNFSAVGIDTQDGRATETDDLFGTREVHEHRR